MCVFQMVDEWEEIGVGYPQLVMTVTGWVDTIQVDSWSMRPLHVVVVPFSHQDPGKIIQVKDIGFTLQLAFYLILYGIFISPTGILSITA